MPNVSTGDPKRKSRLRDVADTLADIWAALGPHRTAALLGLRCTTKQRYAIIACPWHDDKTPSCSIAIGRLGTLRVHCFSCHQTWDIHSLVARVHGLDTRTDWRRVLATEIDLLQRHDLRLDDLQQPDPEPAPLHPPSAVVSFLLGRCVRVDQDRHVYAYLKRRKLDPRAIAIRDLAYALPRDARLPRWCFCRGKPWTKTGHRLLVPVYDAAGSLAGVRAWRITDDDRWPKRLSPAGFTLSGTVLADSLGRELLRRGTWPSDWTTAPPTVTIAEGEPDFLTAATTTTLYSTPTRAILGVFSGAWSDSLAARIPSGAKVCTVTHTDDAGQRYAQQIVTTLGSRCEVYT